MALPDDPFHDHVTLREYVDRRLDDHEVTGALRFADETEARLEWQAETRQHLEGITPGAQAAMSEVYRRMEAVELHSQQFMTREEFQRFEQRQDDNRAQGRRAIQTAIVSLAVGAGGWLVLLVTHYDAVPHK